MAIKLNMHFNQILSCGYGLSFFPVPVMAAIGTLISADMGDPTGYIWFVPVRNSFEYVEDVKLKFNVMSGMDHLNYLCLLDLVCLLAKIILRDSILTYFKVVRTQIFWADVGFWYWVIWFASLGMLLSLLPKLQTKSSPDWLSLDSVEPTAR